MKVINENILRKAIRDAILESTNMGTLYHFTDMEGLYGMAESGKINLSDIQKEISGGKNYMSFTRHKSYREGYAAAEGMDLPVRVEFNMARVNSMHGVKTEPFEYYSPNRSRIMNKSGYNDEYDYDPRTNDDESAKEIYRKEYKTYHDDEYARYDEPEHEYCNQAEERLVSDNGFISTAAISRVDVACYDPYGESYDSDEDYGEEIDEAFENFAETDDYMVSETIRQARELLQLKNCHIPLNRIFFYDNEADFIRQTDNCLTLPQFVQRIGGGSRSRVAESVLMKIVSKAVRKVLNEEEQRYNVGKIGKWNRIPSNGYEFHKIPGKGTCVGIMMYVDNTSEMEIPPTYCLFRRGDNGKYFYATIAASPKDGSKATKFSIVPLKDIPEEIYKDLRNLNLQA